MSGPEISFGRREERRRRARWGRFRRWGLGAAALGLPFAVLPTDPAKAQALPTGGNVVGGSGTISQTGANQLTINQNSSTLSIDWQSFSVGAGNIVRFIQPDSSSLALNRVIGPDPSMIFGSIQANGRVVIMNPAGIYFGPTAMVDVNGLVATTSRMNQADFLAGNLNFSIAGDVNARVINEGFVNVALGGFAVLSAAAVENKGTIVAQGGTVVLAGTPTFTLDFFGDGLLKFASTGTVNQAPTGANALVENSGTIQADGGRVLMTARAARDVINNVINVTGIVEARSARVENGEIVIDGGENGIVSVNATLDVSGQAADAKGGTIKVLGEKVGLFENARLDASGDAGGGTVLVGGNYQGKGPEANAKMVYMDARAVIDASSALADGGRVILWSDEATRNAGHIDVSGAVNGGFIEVSSKGFLDFRGTVGLRGATGTAGTLLLDPTDITISGSASSGDMSGSSPFAGTNASSNLDASVLNAALASGDVTVTTASAGGGTGNIDVTATIVNAVAGRTLTLRADGAITIGSGGYISGSGYALNVSLRAGGNITVGGLGISTSGGYIETTGTTGSGLAGGSFVSTASINTTSGHVTLQQTGTIAIGGTLNTSGIVTLNAGGTTTQTYAITGSGSLVVGGTGAVTLNDPGNTFANITLNRTGTTTNVSLNTSVSPTLQASTLGTGTYFIGGVGFGQSGAITQDAGGGAVTIQGNTGTVTLSGGNAWTGALTALGGTINVTSAQTATGAGSIALDATRDVAIGANLTTATGDILIKGNVSSWATPYASNTPVFGSASGNFAGVLIDPGVSVTTAGGNIAIAGKGGSSASNNGVFVNGGTIQAGGAGSVTVYGAGTASGAHGVEIYNGGVTAGGALSITGGNGAGGDADMFGVVLNGGSVTAGGNLSLIGRGGAGGSGSGLYQVNASSVSSTGGSITLVGETTNATAGGVNLAGGSVSATGAGAITISSAKNVTIGINVSSASGDITLMGNVASWTGDKSVNDPTFGTASGDFAGVSISGGADITSTGGNIFIAGKGGTTGANQYGIGVGASSIVSTTGAGKVVMHGMGGPSAYDVYGSGGSHTGIYLNGAAPGTAVEITTQNGLLKLVGTGNQSGGATDNNGGVAFQWAKAISTGSGDIAITGTSATTGSGRGVYIGLTGSEVTTASGNVTIIGTGGGADVTGAGFYSAGVEIAANGIVRSTGAGNVTVTGIAGSSGAGLQFSGASATVGDAAMTGNLTLRSNSISNSASTLSLLGTSGGTISFTGETDSTTIGVNGGSGTAAVSALLFGWVSGFGTLQIGSSTQTGDIQVDSTGFNNNLTLRTQGAIYTNALTMGAFNLFVIADGGFTQGAGSITTSGTATFFGPGDVTATNAGNSFGTLIISKSGSSANVNIATPGSGFNLGTVNMGTGTLTLSADRITLTGSLSTSGGAVSLTADRYIAIGQNIDTQGGDITMSANAAGTGGGDDFAGVFINASAVQSHGGNIDITGKGSAYGTSVTGQHGIFLYNGGIISSYTGGGDGTTGTITLSGTGGTFAGTGNGGVVVSGAGSSISSYNGAIAITATGGTGGIGNSGLWIGGGTIQTTGTGNITVTATSGAGIADASRGIVVTGSGSGVYGRIETTGAGDITLTGNGVANGVSSHGVYVYDVVGNGSNYGVVRATGTGGVTVTGTGGAGTGSSGVTLENAGASAISTASGNLSITGTGVAATNGHGIFVDNAAFGTTGGNATVIGTATDGLGIYLSIATVSTAGAGSLSISGTSTNQQGFIASPPTTITTASGAMTLASNNGLDFTNAALVSGGGLTLTGGAGAIAATNAGNDITGTITFSNSAGNVALANGGGKSISLGASTAAGALTAVADAGISQTGALTVGGNAIFGALGGGIDLATNGAGNSFGGTVSLTSSVGNVSVAAAGDLTLASVAMDGNFTATASGIITLSGGLTMTTTPGRSVTMTSTGVLAGINIEGAITLNNGSVTLASDNWISIDHGISTGGGNILMDATGIYSGTYVGVSIVNNAVIDAGGGNISIDGTGGNTGAGQHGVTMDGSTLTTSGAGTISVTGQGGPSTGGGSRGIYLQGGADIQTVNGALTVNATGSAAGGFSNDGIKVAGSTIRTTGSGSIGITGNAGAYGAGFYLAGTNAAVRTGNGNLSVTGHGMHDQSGVVMINDSGTGVIESTGTGNVSVTGTGGASPGSTVYGIRLADAVTIASNSGTLTLTGTGGSGAGGGADGINVGNSATVSSGAGLLTLDGTGGTNVGDGVKVAAGGIVTANAGNIVMNGESTGGYGIAIAGDIGDGGMSGNITLNSDTFNITTATATMWTTGGVTIKPLLGSVGIGIGGGTGTLQLGNDFTNILASSLHIGSATTQTIDVGAGGLLGASNVPVYLEGSDIALIGTVDVLGGKVTLHAHSGGVAQANGSNVIAQNLILRGTGIFDLTRGGVGYNGIARVSANVTGDLHLRMTGGGGYADAAIASDTAGTVTGITTTGDLTWQAQDSIGQLTGAVLNIGGTTQLESVAGGITLFEAGNNLGTSIDAINGVGTLSLRSGSIAVGAQGVASTGDLILYATAGGITQNSAVAAGGNFVASATGGGIAMGGFGNSVAGNTSLTTSGGKANIAWLQNNAMIASNISSTGALTIDVTGGSISQVGAISAADPSSISATGNIALTHASNAFGGALMLTATSGSVAVTNSGNLTLSGVTAGNGLTVTAGGTLSQSGTIAVTGGSTTLSATGTMTLTNGANNFGGALALTGVGGDIQGTAPATASVTAVGNGFTFNSTAIANSSGGGGSGGGDSQGTTTNTVTTETLAQIITQILTSTTTQPSSSTGPTDATTVNPVSPAAVQAMLIAILAEAAAPAGGEPGGGESNGNPQIGGGVGTGGAPAGTPAVAANAGTFGAGTTITINTSGGAVQSITVTPVGGGAPVTILPGLLNLTPPAIPTATATGTPGISGNFPLSWRQ